MGCIKIGCAVLLIVLMCIFTGCYSDNPADPTAPSASMTSYDGCKDFDAGSDFPPPSSECVEYVYSKNAEQLILRHLNAGFNCCPETLTFDLDAGRNHITITSWETYEDDGPCRCDCLFDVTYELVGITPDSYRISVKCSLADPVIFEVDLQHDYSGWHCVDRHDHPWGDGS